VRVLRFTHFVVHSSLLFAHFDVFLVLKLARFKCRPYIKSLILREELILRFLSALFKSVTEVRGDATEKWGKFYVNEKCFLQPWGKFYVNEKCFLQPHRIVRTVGQSYPFFIVLTKHHIKYI